MSFYEFILWALQPVMENTACGPDTQKDHQQSMGFGNPALPGSEATREAGVSMQIPSGIQLSNDLLPRGREKPSS